MPCDYKASKDNIEHFLENSAAYPTPLQSITASQLNELYDSCTWKAPLLEAKDKTNLLTWLARHYPDRKAEGNWSGWVRTVVQKSIDLREQSGVQSDAMDEAMDENYAFNVQGQKDGIGGRVSTKVNLPTSRAALSSLQSPLGGSFTRASPSNAQLPTYEASTDRPWAVLSADSDFAATTHSTLPTTIGSPFHRVNNNQLTDTIPVGETSRLVNLMQKLPDTNGGARALVSNDGALSSSRAAPTQSKPAAFDPAALLEQLTEKSGTDDEETSEEDDDEVDRSWHSPIHANKTGSPLSSPSLARSLRSSSRQQQHQHQHQNHLIDLLNDNDTAFLPVSSPLRDTSEAAQQQHSTSVHSSQQQEQGHKHLIDMSYDHDIEARKGTATLLHHYTSAPTPLQSELVPPSSRSDLTSTLDNIYVSARSHIEAGQFQDALLELTSILSKVVIAKTESQA